MTTMPDQPQPTPDRDTGDEGTLPARLAGVDATLPTIWQQAWVALDRFCRETYRMSIPVQDDDDDRVIARALETGMALEAEVARLQAERDALQPIVDAAERLAAKVEVWEQPGNYTVSIGVVLAYASSVARAVAAYRAALGQDRQGGGEA